MPVNLLCFVQQVYWHGFFPRPGNIDLVSLYYSFCNLQPLVFSDSYANPIAGATVTISGGYGVPASGTTDANGYFAISITPTNLGGPYPLSFAVTSSSGNLNVATGSITVVTIATPTLSISLAVSQYVALSGIPLYITSTLLDPNGNPINGANVTITTPADPAATLANSPPSGPTANSKGSIPQTTGTYATGQVGANIAFSSTGTQTVEASYTSGSQTITAKLSVQVTQATTANIIWSNISPTNLVAGQYLSVSGQALTQYGVGVPNGTAVTLSVAGNTATFYTYQSGSNYGYFNGQIMVKKAGTFNVQATSDGNSFTSPSPITVVAGPFSQLSINYDTGVEDQNAILGKTIYLHAQDSFGNGVSGVSVTLTLNGSNMEAPISYEPGVSYMNSAPVNPSPTDSSGYAQVTETPQGVISENFYAIGYAPSVLVLSGDYSYTATANGISVTGGTFHVNHEIAELAYYTYTQEIPHGKNNPPTYAYTYYYYLADFMGELIDNYSIPSSVPGGPWVQTGTGGYTSSSGGTGTATAPGISGTISSWPALYVTGTSSPRYIYTSSPQYVW